MGEMWFRDEPDYADVAKVESLLKRTAFFSPDEEEIGVSLVAERLEKIHG